MKNKKINSSVLFLSILIAIMVVSHLEWFNPNSILSTGDWLYWYKETMEWYIVSYTAWLGDRALGYPNIQLYFFSFESIWSLLTRIGITTELASKLVIFFPIAISGFISPYILINKLINHKMISFISALFYASTTYFLILQASHLTIAFVYSITPFIFLVLIKALEKNTITYWIVFSVIYSIGISYELRIMYIVSFLILFYFLFFHALEIKRYFKKIIMAGTITLLLNSYWFLPTVLGKTTGTINEVANRAIFGDNLVDITRSFTLSNWGWTGLRPDRFFDLQPIFPYFWILPILIFFTFLFKKNKYLKEMLFYLVILLLGIFLTKQSGLPFKGSFVFLRDYFPGFVIFRESSKFYLIIAFGYLGLISYGLKLISEKFKNKKILFFVYALVICLFLWNLKPLITKEYGTTFVPREIPREYITYKNLVVGENQNYRILWIPIPSRWSYFSLKNPKLSGIDLVNVEWKDFEKEKDKEKLRGERLMQLLKQQNISKLIDFYSIKYLVVPIEDNKTDLEDLLFWHYSKPRSFYVENLNSLDNLKKIDVGAGSLEVYENIDFRPRIYITNEIETINHDIPVKNVNFTIRSSSKYSIVIENVIQPFYLNFSEAFHPGWKLRLGKFSWIDTLINNNYFLTDKNHFQNDAKLNSFYVDPTKACQQFTCSKNQDGSYKLNLTLYFRPQSYMILGLIITGATTLFIIGYLLVIFINYEKRKK